MVVCDLPGGHQRLNPMSSLTAHNSIVRSYFDIARKIAVEAADPLSEHDKRSRVSVVVVMAVAAVEAFINIFGRMWIVQVPDFIFAEKINDDLKRKKFITYKVKSWPKLLFSQDFDLLQGPCKDFLDLIEKRNRLMHFTSDYHIAQSENVTIKGLIDIAAFDSLTPKDAEEAIRIAERFIEAWISLQGLERNHVMTATAHWTGNMVRCRT